MALEDLRAQSPAAADVVVLCAFFGATDIPRRLLLAGADVLGEERGAAVRDQLELIEAAARISNAGLMRVDGDSLNMHREVQAAIRDSLAEEELGFRTDAACRVLLAAFPERPESFKEWPVAARLVPHALVALEHLGLSEVTSLAAADLGQRVAAYLIAQGQLDDAGALLEEALSAAATLEPGSRLHARVLNRWAILERERGRFNDAWRDARTAFSMHVAALQRPSSPHYRAPEPGLTGDDDAREGVTTGAANVPADRDVASTLLNLAAIARQLGLYNECLAYLHQASVMRVELFGAESPELADVLVEYFEFEVRTEQRRALDTLRRAVEIYEKAYGPEDKEVALTRLVLDVATEQQESDTLAREMLATQEALYGAGHPETAHALALVASILRQLEQYDEARRIAEQALEIDLDNFGPTHFRVGDRHAELMSIEAAAGNVEAAERQLRDVIEVVKAAPPAERSATLGLAGVDRHLRDMAMSEGGRGVAIRTATLLEEAFANDDAARDAALDIAVSGLLKAGDGLLSVGDVEAASEQYERGLEAAERTTENPLDDSDFHVRLAAIRIWGGDATAGAEHIAAAMRCLAEGGLRAPIWTLLRLASGLHHHLGRPPELRAALDAAFDDAVEEASMSIFRPELSAPLPENWFAKESITLLAPDGQANVIASSEPLDPTITLDSYAEEQGELLKEFNKYRELSYEPIEVLGGRPGYLRQFEWTPPDGAPVTQIQIHYVEAGRGYTATATSPSEEFSGRELVLREVLRGLRLTRDRD